MKKQISVLIYILVIGGLFFSPLTKFQVAHAEESVQSGFKPDKLIDDRVFSDSKTMTAADIQKFLKDKNSILADTSSSFVSQLKEPVSNQSLKETLKDPNASSTTPRTAAELIYDAAKSTGLNPQVILVTLNKEQSLITGRQTSTAEQIQRALDFALGFGCPDSQPCGDIYRGFYFQLFGGVDAENNRYLGAAGSLMKSFETPGGRGPWYNGGISKVGDTIVLNNTVGNYEGVQPQQTITLGNSATAALYRYTPHVFNGNYNFWRFFKMWFGSTGTESGDSSSSVDGLVKTSTNGDVYIVENGTRYRVLSFVAEARGLKLSKAKKISKKAFGKYSDGGMYSVPDNTLIKVDDKYYLFLANQKRSISEEGIKGRGLKTSNAIKVSSSDADKFTTGTEISISEGAILKSSSNPSVYLLTNGKLKLFTYATFLQYSAAANMQVVADSVVNGYEKDGLVLPKPGSLVKSFNSTTVYFYEDGQKKPMDGEIFRNRGFSFTNVYELTDAEIDALPIGPFPLPANNTFFQDKKTSQLFWYTDGKKRSISAFVAKQKSITPDFTFGEDTIKNLPDGTPVLPKEGTVFKSDKKADVYIINATLAFPMTSAAFTARSITPDQVNVLPQSEVDSYPKGSLLTK